LPLGKTEGIILAETVVALLYLLITRISELVLCSHEFRANFCQETAVITLLRCTFIWTHFVV